MKLLARALTAIATNAVMDCWNRVAWIACTDSRCVPSISQGQVAVLRNRSDLSSTRVLTILHLLILKYPSEERGRVFRRSSGATVVPDQGSHYDLA